MWYCWIIIHIQKIDLKIRRRNLNRMLNCLQNIWKKYKCYVELITLSRLLKTAWLKWGRCGITLTFSTKHNKFRVVYDGFAKFQGVCISGIILILAWSTLFCTYWLLKNAFMTGLKEFFFQIMIDENQQDLFKIL